jgi:predicted AlkP superfamily pyrophosphatase or phosphodiesterase
MTTGIRRVIIVVLDGLRPDAIDEFDLSNIRTLMTRGARFTRHSRRRTK